jgi:hypothetical protein
LESRFRVLIWVITVCMVLMGAVYLLFSYYASPDRDAERAARQRSREAHEAFIAEFDSLYHSRLLPTVWRAGVFTKTAFDNDFTEWTLTISSNDWYFRETESKKDLVARLWTAYRGTRAQAGGDPDDARLIIADDEDRKVATSGPEGIRIIR